MVQRNYLIAAIVVTVLFVLMYTTRQSGNPTTTQSALLPPKNSQYYCPACPSCSSNHETGSNKKHDDDSKPCTPVPCSPVPCTPSHAGTQTTSETKSKFTAPTWLQDCYVKMSGWDPALQKAQYKQDITMWEKFFPNKCFGTYLEMGAYNGFDLSNTHFFDKVLGWRGVLVEANPKYFKDIAKNRPHAYARNAAITNKTGTVKYMAIDGWAAGLSGIVDFYTPEHLQRIYSEVNQYGGNIDEIEIESLPLHQILIDAGMTHIDFFSLDTEGSELSILSSCDWSLVDIDYIMIENNYGGTLVADFMAKIGYTAQASIGSHIDVVYKKNK